MVPGEAEWGFQILPPHLDGTPRFAPVKGEIYTHAFRQEVSRAMVAMIRERAQIGIGYTREQHLALIPQVALIMRDVWEAVAVNSRNPGLVAQVFDAQVTQLLVEAGLGVPSVGPVIMPGAGSEASVHLGDPAVVPGVAPVGPVQPEGPGQVSGGELEGSEHSEGTAPIPCMDMEADGFVDDSEEPEEAEPEGEEQEEEEPEEEEPEEEEQEEDPEEDPEEAEMEVFRASSFYVTAPEGVGAGQSLSSRQVKMETAVCAESSDSVRELVVIPDDIDVVQLSDDDE